VLFAQGLAADRPHRHRWAAAGSAGPERSRPRTARSKPSHRPPLLARRCSVRYPEEGPACGFLTSSSTADLRERHLYHRHAGGLNLLSGAAVTEYPGSALPHRRCERQLAGASAEVIAQTVAAGDRAGDQRRRQHALLGFESTGNGALSISVVFKRWDEHRPGAGAGAEPRLGGLAAAAAGGQRRRDSAQEFPT
jgi:hypothetical protein